MSGLDRVKNVSSEPAIAPVLQSEDLYAQTTTTSNLVVKETVTLPVNYVDDLINSNIQHPFLLMGA
jgi:hypothetical protein